MTRQALFKSKDLYEHKHMTLIPATLEEWGQRLETSQHGIKHRVDYGILNKIENKVDEKV